MAGRIVLRFFLCFTTLLCGFQADAQPGDVHKMPLLVRSNKIFIQAAISGKPALLQIDTGATVSTFKLKLVPKHDKLDEIIVKTANSAVQSPQIKTVVDIGGAEGIHTTINAIYGEFEFGVADGVLGMDVLGSYSSFSIDLKGQQLTVVE